MKNKKFHLLVLFFTLALGLFFVLAGCPGPMGPAGPQGIPGEGTPGEKGEDGEGGIILEYYTVAYDANGGEGEMESSSFPIGFWDRLEANAFTNDGFVFNGWAETALGPLAFADRDFVRDLSTTPNDTVTLYAVWGEPNSYTVSYNANGGEGNMSPGVFTLGQINILPLNAFTRANYTFEGWAVEQDGEVIYTDGQIVGYLTTTAGETIYLYSVWKPISYTVIYDANGGNGTMEDSIFTYDEPQALRACSFTRSGYPFTGWATEPEGPIVYTDGEDFQYHVPPAEKTLTLYAVWVLAGSFTVTFEPANGSPAATQTVYWGDLAEKPAEPVNTNITIPGLYAGTGSVHHCIFNGWYKGDTEWDFETPVTEDITLSAQWGPIDISGISTPTGDTLIDKAFAYTNANPGEYTLFIGEDIDITGSDDRALNQSNIQLKLLGFDTERKISLTSQGSMFAVGASGQAGISLTLGENITLVGYSNNNRSLVYVKYSAALIMQGNSKITGNTASGDGGGVYVESYYYVGGFTMQGNATVSGNTAENGGGVYVIGNGSLSMQGNASVSGNTAENGGGVFVGFQANFTMRDNASVSGNTAAGWGGGVFVSGRNFGEGATSFNMLDETSVYGNTTGGNGGGVYVDNGADYGGYFEMRGNAEVYENTAGGDGGGVYVDGNIDMYDEASVYRNTAEGNGGGVYSNAEDRNGFNMVGNAEVYENTAGGDGGGVYVICNNPGSGFIMRYNASVYGNTANSGGGVYVSGFDGRFHISGNSTVSDNTAENNGGGVYITGRYSSFIMRDDTMLYENTSGSGGGVYVAGGSFIMQGNAWMSGNEAISSSSYGGGVHVAGGSFAMRDNAAMSNNKADYGGAVHVAVSGSFTMQDSTSMYGNTANLGGGVHVAGGSFNMHGDASVYVNTANSGGGVYIMEGTFRISGGAVYGDDADFMNNISNWNLGAALINNSGIAVYGTLGSSWPWFTSYGNLSTRNATIRVVEGRLVPYP